MPAHFYTYQDPNPSTVNTDPATYHWEDPADWPRSFLYVPNHSGAQGIHPPAPVYQTNQPSQPAMYYFQGSASAPAGYYVNGYYYGTSPPTASTGWPYTSSGYQCFTLPTASAPTTTPSAYYPYNYSPYFTAPATSTPYFPTAAAMWAQQSAPAQAAAAAVAANAALAAVPNAPSYFVGATAADIQAQNTVLLANMQQQPNQLVPFKPGASQQFWCKELDGSYTLREMNDALKSDFPAGHWEKASSGYHYFVRHAT